MEKDLNKSREDLIVLSERIEAIGNFMRLTVLDGFDSIEPGSLYHDFGLIIMNASKEIQDITGTYKEAIETEGKEGE